MEILGFIFSDDQEKNMCRHFSHIIKNRIFKNLI